MKTPPCAFTPAQRLELRQMAEHRVNISLLRLLAVVSILRTALTRILPLAGSGAWWVFPVCLLPGCAVYLLLLISMALCRVQTVTDCARVCLGPFGAWLISGVLALLTLMDGASSMTALITLFTEGIGTRGTQITLALLTAAVLLFCLHREGLPRGVYLLRWPILLCLAVLLVSWALDVQVDRLFPYLGSGRSAVEASLRTGWSLAWPLVLLLTVPPVRPGFRRVLAPWPVLALPVVVVLLLTLTVPQEVLTLRQDLATCLLLPTRYATQAVRTLAQCILMLAFFLAVASAAHVTTDRVCAPFRHHPSWLPYAVVLLLTALQALDIRMLWQNLGTWESWSLAPLVVLAVLLLPLSALRRKR